MASMATPSTTEGEFRSLSPQTSLKRTTPTSLLQTTVQSVLTVTSSSHASVHWTDASGRCTVTQSCDAADQNNGVDEMTASVKVMYCRYLCAYM